MTRAALEEQIINAFRNRICPDAKHLIGDERDPNRIDFDGESLEIKRAFSGKQWIEITQKELVNMPQVISFFSLNAFVYYLPAIILATVSFDEETGYLRDGLIDKLTPREDNPHFQKIIKVLTGQQKQVIAAYLRFVSQEVYSNQPLGEAHVALERYWQQFLSSNP